jgi:hypothetical protein
MNYETVYPVQSLQNDERLFAPGFGMGFGFGGFPFFPRPFFGGFGSPFFPRPFFGGFGFPFFPRPFFGGFGFPFFGFGHGFGRPWHRW